MSDQLPDIDIEAERPDFERNALSRGLSVDRNDTGSYLMAVTEYRWRGWMERARLAAEREREMVDLLLEAQREGCTRCYSDAVGLPCCYPHSAQCLRITAALKKGPSDDQRRA